MIKTNLGFENSHPVGINPIVWLWIRAEGNFILGGDIITPKR